MFVGMPAALLLGEFASQVIHALRNTRRCCPAAIRFKSTAVASGSHCAWRSRRLASR